MHLVQVEDIHHPLLALTVDASLQGGSISGGACYRNVLEHSTTLYSCLQQSTCGWSVDIAPAVGACQQTEHLQLEDATILTLSDAGSPPEPHTFFK